MEYHACRTGRVVYPSEMLKLTKKADYGLIALKHLGASSRGSASAKEIADAYGIPLPLLSKVLQKLARAGFLRSEHGTNGGYRLARNAGTDQRAGSDPSHRRTHLPDFVFHGQARVRPVALCTVREPLRKVHEGILKLLASISNR